LTVFDISRFPSISFAAAMATVERRAPAAASSWEPKAARTPVTNGAANGSAAREQYTDHPSTTTGSAEQPLSPGSKGAGQPMSPGAVRNVKAETIAEAHRERVEAEAHTYLQAETRKAEARAATAQSRVEQKKMKEEAKAIENRKREEAKADQVVRAAEVIQRLNKLMLQYDLNAQNLV
jgi:hypothetical protein